MKRVVLCGLAATAMVVSGLSAHAGVVTVGNYYEDTNSVTCATAITCTLFFTQIPAGKRLTVTSISCDFNGWNGLISVARFGAAQPSLSKSRYQPLPVTYTTGSGQYRYYSAALPPTKRVFAATLLPIVTADGIKTSTANMNISIYCQITGQLTNAAADVADAE